MAPYLLVICYALRMGVSTYVDRINFKLTSLVKQKCSVEDQLWCGTALVMTTSLISSLLDKLLQANVTVTITLSILCIDCVSTFPNTSSSTPHISGRHARPHRARIVTDSLAQEEIENLQ